MLKRALVYKLAVLIGFFFVVNSVSISVVSSLSGVDHWGDLTSTQRVVIVASGVANTTNVLLAFFNKTLSRIERGQFPLSTGDTDFWEKPTK